MVLSRYLCHNTILSRSRYMSGIAKWYIAIFSHFWTANHFPKVKLSQHHLFHHIWYIFLSSHLPLIIFYCSFYYLSSEHLAPSSGLTSQLIFIIPLFKKLSLYLQHLKYWYLVSMNWYNIVTQNFAILWRTGFFPHPS